MSEFSEIFGGGGFDATSIKADGFTPLPDGIYQVVVDDCTLNTTKSGTGKYLKLVLTVTCKEYNGRKIFESINIVNDNSKAQEIGRRLLARLCLAIGRSKANDSSDLIGGVCNVKIYTVKRDDGTSETRVKDYLAKSAVAKKTNTAPLPPSAPAVKPWEQNSVDVADSDDLPF